MGEARWVSNYKNAIRVIEEKAEYISKLEMEGLHKKLNMKLLCNRRKLLMLETVYKLSQDAENMNNYRPEITLRTGAKVKRKVEFTDKQHLYRGS